MKVWSADAEAGNFLRWAQCNRQGPQKAEEGVESQSQRDATWRLPQPPLASSVGHHEPRSAGSLLKLAKTKKWGALLSLGKGTHPWQHLEIWAHRGLFWTSDLQNCKIICAVLSHQKTNKQQQQKNERPQTRLETVRVPGTEGRALEPSLSLWPEMLCCLPGGSEGQPSAVIGSVP